MWLVVGLGNPGERHARTRHNAGFAVVEEIARRHGGSWAVRERRRESKVVVESNEALLMEPLTYMNRSGDAVVPVALESAIPPERVLLVYDDLDLDFGKIRIRRGGGTGGHRGVASVVEGLGSIAVPRVRVGIGRPSDGRDVVAWVLEEPVGEEAEQWPDAIGRASDAVASCVARGVDEAMNEWNGLP